MLAFANSELNEPAPTPSTLSFCGWSKAGVGMHECGAQGAARVRYDMHHVIAGRRRLVCLLSGLFIATTLSAAMPGHAQQPGGSADGSSVPASGSSSSAAAPVANPAFRVLLVGGGPDPPDNEVAIESNVRYILRLVPPADPLRVLFASGRLTDRNVDYLDPKGVDRYRASVVKHVDGPATRDSVTRELAWLRADPAAPELLILTGHGGYDRAGRYRDNYYCLWNEDEFHVTDLAAQIAKAPTRVPIVLVMTQCFSGGFMNALFENGDPNGAQVPQNLCGFFATIPSWMAAGCTDEIDEASYKDFTGYFFEALCGIDRLGRTVSVAGYSEGGRVGMDDAFDYALAHDDSIDTPTCTSDIFLRRYVPADDDEIFETHYADVLAWARPCQKAALEALSKSLRLVGEGRLAKAYAEFTVVVETQAEDPTPQGAKYIRFVRLAKSVILEHKLAAGGDADLKARFAALQASEHRNPFAK